MKTGAFYMRIILTIAFLTFSLSVSAQGSQSKRTAIQHITGEQYIHYYAMFDGVPFYKGDWMTGSITMKSGEIYNNLELRYDTYKDNLIYRNDISNNVIIVDKNSIEKFTLVDRNGKLETFKCIEDKTLKDLNGRYVGVILEDSISVLKKCEAKEEKYSNANPTIKKTGAFVHKTTLYSWNKLSLTNVPKIRRSVYKQYPDLKGDIRKFVLHNHIRMKNEDDVRLLYQEINRLIKAEK